MAKHLRAERLFRVCVGLKGLGGVLEVIGGLILRFLNHREIARYIVLLTQPELAEDPTDFIATHLRSWVAHSPLSLQSFIAIYIMIQGAAKIGLAAGLLKNQRWAYPCAIFLLSFSSIYALYESFATASAVPAALSVFDAALVFLIIWKYQAKSWLSLDIRFNQKNESASSRFFQK